MLWNKFIHPWPANFASSSSWASNATVVFVFPKEQKFPRNPRTVQLVSPELLRTIERNAPDSAVPLLILNIHSPTLRRPLFPQTATRFGTSLRRFFHRASFLLMGPFVSAAIQKAHMHRCNGKGATLSETKKPGGYNYCRRPKIHVLSNVKA